MTYKTPPFTTFLFIITFFLFPVDSHAYTLYPDVNGAIKVQIEETQEQQLRREGEAFQKEQADAARQAREDLKDLSARIDGQIKTGNYCFLPKETCSESTYQSIRGSAISSGLTPDPNQLADCRAKIDEYNLELQEYNKCQEDWRKQKIDHAAEMEYKTEQLRQKSNDLTNLLGCQKKEGPYSTYNTRTGFCECVTGAQFVSGTCKRDYDIKKEEGIPKKIVETTISCVKAYGPLAEYEPARDICTCAPGSNFDLQNGVCVVGPVVTTSEEKSTSIVKKTSIFGFPVKASVTVPTKPEPSSNRVTMEPKKEVSTPTVITESQQTVSLKAKVQGYLLRIKWW